MWIVQISCNTIPILNITLRTKAEAEIFVEQYTLREAQYQAIFPSETFFTAEVLPNWYSKLYPSQYALN